MTKLRTALGPSLAVIVISSYMVSVSALAKVTDDMSVKTPPILSPYNLTQEQIATLDMDVPILDIWEGAMNRNIVEVFGAIDVNASPQQLWDIMKNCELQLQIISNMTRCEIQKQDVAAGWDERVQVLKIGRFLPRVKSKFRSEYTPYRTIKITRTGGDLSVLDGIWSLSSTHDNQTRIAYRARLKPKLPVPRKLMQKATRKDMPAILMNLRDLAENRNTQTQPSDTSPHTTTSTTRPMP